MTRPHIICHMITTLDGRLATERWPVSEDRLLQVYDAAVEEMQPDGWITGRETMGHYMAAGEPQLGPARENRADRIGDAAGRGLGICFDRSGRLRPKGEDLDGDHLVMVLSQRVSQAHVDHLASLGISVVFSGPEGADLAGALARIGAAFGVTRLVLEGGGRINGAFLSAGLIDETSTLVHPTVDGQGGVPAIYDHAADTRPRTLELMSVTTREDGVVWMRHRVQS
ncbi:dihydrofolate reductase family protein [Ferrimonas balearica]|nr:dihydrofolate reductase family protein [Ferrimonas balearica]